MHWKAFVVYKINEIMNKRFVKVTWRFLGDTLKFGQYHQRKHRNLSQAVQVAKKIQNRKQFQERIIFSEIVRLELLLFENYVKRFALNPFRLLFYIFCCLYLKTALSRLQTIGKFFSIWMRTKLAYTRKNLGLAREKTVNSKKRLNHGYCANPLLYYSHKNAR